MNICILSGSARENNNTIRVAYALRDLLSPQFDVSLIDFREYDIPFINQQEIIPENLSPFQQQLTSSMQKANWVILISPEYNWSTTPEILNFLHRFGDTDFSAVFNNKVFSLIGVSTGKGGKTPALHLTSVLNKIISFLNLESVVSPKIFESHFTKEALDETGKSLGNALYDRGLQSFVAYSIKVVKRWGV